MVDSKKISIESVIKKISILADINYNGEIKNNLLKLYGLLSVEEQNLVIINFYNIYSIYESTDTIEVNKSNTLLNDLVIDKINTDVDTRIAVHNELQSIEHLNKHELIKLKTWLVKLLAVLISLFLFGFASLTIFVNTDIGNNIPIFSKFIKLILIMFK